jgi:tetratricopeptide (TPR) repeat protein
MLLTQCPACAAPLPDLTAKQCSRCKTRYCGAACQKKHWEEGGHDQLCRRIRKGGGAEQYHADTNYTEAVAVAAKECAEDTKGQTCYICTQALHWKTKEGLVRMCACRGTAGFAHVSCLVEQAKLLFAEAEENNLAHEVLGDRWTRWETCSLCKQKYHGVVKCALGWACWKTYVGRPETDKIRLAAISEVGNGLSAALRHEDALSVRKAELAMKRRLITSEAVILNVQGSLARTYSLLGRTEEALSMQRDVYAGSLKLYGEEDIDTLREASNYASILGDLKRFEEAKALLRKTLPVAGRILGEDHRRMLEMRCLYAVVLCQYEGATLGDLSEAVSTLEELAPTARRVLGATHPTAKEIEGFLQHARAALLARQGVDVSAVCAALDAMKAT